jgi:hypothetical protein
MTMTIDDDKEQGYNPTRQEKCLPPKASYLILAIIVVIGGGGGGGASSQNTSATRRSYYRACTVRAGIVCHTGYTKL